MARVHHGRGYDDGRCRGEILLQKKEFSFEMDGKGTS